MTKRVGAVGVLFVLSLVGVSGARAVEKSVKVAPRPAFVVPAPAATPASALPPGVAPCVRQYFKTVTIKAACSQGGQEAAKDSDKAFSKRHSIQSCNECHSTLAPNYSLKDDGLQRYFKYGGT